jgi:hypothetical protein
VDVFDADVLDVLDRTREVDVETWAVDGTPRRTVIWVVVADGAPYIRSVRGGRGRWYRDLLREPHGALWIGARRIPFRALPATDEASVAAFDRAVQHKYGARSASTQSMLLPHTLDTTIRLEPA